MSQLAAPQVTIYARLLDNISKEEISGFQPVNRRSNFGFGVINGISGGESPVIVEFDIWNNEPAITGGLTAIAVSDAINCSFTAWDSEKCNSSEGIIAPTDSDSKRTPYVHARCVSVNNHSKFYPIAGARTLPPSELINSVSNDSGTLSGVAGGDHIKVQTKIVIPRYTTSGINNFVFEFKYDYL